MDACAMPHLTPPLPPQTTAPATTTVSPRRFTVARLGCDAFVGTVQYEIGTPEGDTVAFEVHGV